jgi:hypothetical protein
MDADEFTDTLRDAHETPLSRLGSSKSLYALTGGEMTGASVRATVAREATLTAETLADWREDASGDDADATSDAADATSDAAALYADIADHAHEHADTAGEDPTDRAFPELERLADAETIPERLGGLLARQLLAEIRIGQVVGFFVGDADPASAGDFRSVRGDIEDDHDRVAALLTETCESDDDWDAARETADAVLEAAYDDYVETLESMGVKPKNVC